MLPALPENVLPITLGSIANHAHRRTTIPVQIVGLVMREHLAVVVARAKVRICFMVLLVSISIQRQ